uniref:Uncharacterized protein n=1 Tax=Cannabis sativa TaxID=3483 RepID=A0A803QW25_CANSA
MALLASMALAAVAATITPTSLSEALIKLIFATGVLTTLTPVVVFIILVEPAVTLRPVNDGMVTDADVMVAMVSGESVDWIGLD